MGSLTDERPKPILFVGDRPFLDVLLQKAVRHGLTEIILLAGYLGKIIENYYEENPVPGATIRVVIESEPLGTGGALAAAAEFLDDFFLLANGDTLFDFNWLDLLVWGGKARAAVALRRIKSPGRYSQVFLERGIISSFGEPQMETDDCLTNGGVYLMSKEILSGFGEGTTSLERDVFPRLAKEGKLNGIVVDDAYFIDMGIPADYARANKEIPLRTTRKAVVFAKSDLSCDTNAGGRDLLELLWMPGAREAIRLANDLGFFVFMMAGRADFVQAEGQSLGCVELNESMNRDLASIGAYIGRFDRDHGDVGAEIRVERLLAYLNDWCLTPLSCLFICDDEAEMSYARNEQIDSHLIDGSDLKIFLSQRLSDRHSQ